jgi:hypothetical protein
MVNICCSLCDIGGGVFTGDGVFQHDASTLDLALGDLIPLSM